MGGMTQQGEWPSGLKGSDEVSEAAREDRPDKSGKSSVRPLKAPQIGKEYIEHLIHLQSVEADLSDVKTLIQS
jgi:hypothetical protein